MHSYRRIATIIVLTAVLGLAGCSTLSLRTANAPTTACDLALARGILASSRESGLALREPEGPNIIVLWPFGYSSRGFVGSMELVDPTGSSIAREGDTVEMAGGMNLDGVFVACAGTIKKVAPPG
jgi:hypothetical protein